MTIGSMRLKVHKFVDEADADVLKIIYQIFERYNEKSQSLLTEEQQKIVIERSNFFNAGKTKGYSIEESRKLIKKATNIKNDNLQDDHPGSSYS